MMVMKRTVICLMVAGAVASPATAEPPAAGQSADGTAGARQPPAPASAPGSQPARPPAASPTAGDPFRRLRVKTPKDRLPPLRSVRIRDRREKATGKITITIKSRPSGAKVYHGRRLLGSTPLKVTAERNSTPLDIVLRRGGYMILRSRIMRRVTRSYFFDMSPAKLQ